MYNYSSNCEKENYEKECSCKKHSYTTTGYYKCSYYPTPWGTEEDKNENQERPNCREEKQNCNCVKEETCHNHKREENKRECGCQKENENRRPCQRQNRNCCFCNRLFW